MAYEIKRMDANVRQNVFDALLLKLGDQRVVVSQDALELYTDAFHQLNDKFYTAGFISREVLDLAGRINQETRRDILKN